MLIWAALIVLLAAIGFDGQPFLNLVEAIGQAFEFVADLSTEPQEEERPWWK